MNKDKMLKISRDLINSFIEKNDVTLGIEHYFMFSITKFLLTKEQIIKKNNNLIEYVLVMMDLNGLKEANDNIGHEAGDELIIGASKCMDKAFSGLGRTYRVGGDEFVALLRGTREEAQDAVKTFDYLTENFQGNLISEISVSRNI